METQLPTKLQPNSPIEATYYRKAKRNINFSFFLFGLIVFCIGLLQFFDVFHNAIMGLGAILGSIIGFYLKIKRFHYVYYYEIEGDSIQLSMLNHLGQIKRKSFRKSGLTAYKIKKISFSKNYELNLTMDRQQYKYTLLKKSEVLEHYLKD